MRWRGRAAAAATLILGLSGCVVRPVPISGPEAPLTVALSVPAPPPPRPEPPAGLPASFSSPPRLPNGAYLTINSNLSTPEVVWHLRSALNVAALGCRGPQSAVIVADYNTLLSQQQTPLKQAYDATRAKFKASFGKDWEDQFDQNSTRVYNYFAQPIAHDDFCIAAGAVAEQAKTVPGPALDTFAQAVLPRLEQPFIEVYRAYDTYKSDLADWNARWAQAQPVSPVPVPTVLTAPADAGASAPRLPYEQVGVAEPVPQPAG